MQSDLANLQRQYHLQYQIKRSPSWAADTPAGGQVYF